MTKAHFVKKARKDVNDEIKKGDSYWWWTFRCGGKYIKYVSKTPPKRQQLTQSEFTKNVYGIEDDLDSIKSADDIESGIESAVCAIEDLVSECQDRLDSMPEQLQESSSSGQLLQERIDSLQDWMDTLQSVDTEIDESLSNEEKDNRVQEIIEEIQSAMPGF